MKSERHRLIEQRAYALWQAEGQPHGKHEEHWRRAAHDVEVEESASVAVENGLPRAARRGTFNAASRRASPRAKKAKA